MKLDIRDDPARENCARLIEAGAKRSAERDPRRSSPFMSSDSPDLRDLRGIRRSPISGVFGEPLFARSAI